MTGWFGDLGRLYWGHLYWNLRKSLFRLRGASGAAPCQHPSDSGLAGETGCEACAGWSDRGRFHRLCPLLATAPDGRRVCSVNASAVRPFWGRAVLLYAGSAAAAACLAVLAAFAGFRMIGYRVPLRVVAWPPAWKRIHGARADYFYRMALRSFDAGDIRQSYLALSQAYALDPDNLAVARLLAQLTQIGNPDYSDAIYARLLDQDRANFESVGEDWVRALIARGDFASVAGLSSRMLREGAKRVPAWTQALVFSERMTGDPAEIDRLLSGPARIPEEARSVFSLDRSIRTGSPEQRLRVVQLYMGGATSALELYFSLTRLIELGRPSDVATFVEGPAGAALNSYDREALKLDAYAGMGWHLLVRKEIAYLLEQGASAPVVTLIAAHLVRHPDAETAEYVFQLFDRRPVAATAEFSGPHLALLCAAGVNGLGARVKQEGECFGRIVGGSFPAWMRARDFFDGAAHGGNPALVMPALGQVPLELMYAVFEHYRAITPHPATPQPSAART